MTVTKRLDPIPFPPDWDVWDPAFIRQWPALRQWARRMDTLMAERYRKGNPPA